VEGLRHTAKHLQQRSCQRSVQPLKSWIAAELIATPNSEQTL
jgi:hypothetical protein